MSNPVCEPKGIYAARRRFRGEIVRSSQYQQNYEHNIKLGRTGKLYKAGDFRGRYTWPVASIIFRTFDSVATQLSCEFFFF